MTKSVVFRVSSWQQMQAAIQGILDQYPECGAVEHKPMFDGSAVIVSMLLEVPERSFRPVINNTPVRNEADKKRK